MSPHFFFIHPAKTKNKLYNMCFIKLFLIPSFKTQHRKNLFGRTTSLSPIYNDPNSLFAVFEMTASTSIY